MKKLSLILSVFMVVLLFAGCDLFDRDEKRAPLPGDISSDLNGATADNNASAKISADRAKEIAFQRAGIKAEDAKRLEVEYDYDDDWHGYEYSVEFEAGGYEYDCEINAQNGAILKFEKDKDLF